MTDVTLRFTGDEQGRAAQLFWSWVVDGGGEDVIADLLRSEQLEAELTMFDEKTGMLSFSVERARSERPVLV